MLKLSPSFQEYHWGKKGSESRVGVFKKSFDSTQFNEEIHYAEMWMGTHSSGPSKVVGSSLSEDQKD